MSLLLFGDALSVSTSIAGAMSVSLSLYDAASCLHLAATGVWYVRLLSLGWSSLICFDTYVYIYIYITK